MAEAGRQAADGPADPQGAQVLRLPTAAAGPGPADPWAEVLDLLTRTQQVLEREGWTPERSGGLRGPYSLTDALAAAAFPAGPADERRDEAATRTFIAAWEQIARASGEELRVTPLEFEADPSIEQHHVVALLECTKLRLRARASDPQPA
jgi:hypothetical protein